MSIVIAGERSGVGKTTVTLALLASLKRRGHSVQSFKVGPDYIDPMFHAAITGRPCRNLDPVLTSERYVQACFATHCTADYGVVEGVMGLFDGAVGNRDWASTAHIAKLLNLPVVLVIDCGKLSRSVAALVHGYRSFDRAVNLAGVILNRVSGDRHQLLLEQALSAIEMPIFGVLRREEPIKIPDRYLGLVPTDELTEFDALRERLADLGDRALAWAQLTPLLAHPFLEVPATSHPPQSALVSDPVDDNPVEPKDLPANRVPVAIARDAAFNFYYQDNLDRLRAAGAELVFWSPLRDPFPEGVAGLLLGGGFPELFAAELATNQRARATIQRLVQAGMPTYAECGGLMYLCQTLETASGQTFPMVGILPTTVQMGGGLHLGYRSTLALQDTPLMAKGTEAKGHEFHHSRLQQPLSPALLEIRAISQSHRPAQLDGWGSGNLHASYVHFHWGDRPEFTQRFVATCRQWLLSARLNR